MPISARKLSLSTATERDDMTKIFDSLRSIVQAIRISARESEQKLGISSAQLYILQQLEGQPAQSINQLAERTFTHQSSVSMVVAKLVENRLVIRTAARGDARRLSVSISAAGRAILRKAPKAEQGRLVDAMRSMKRSDLSDLARGLQSLTRTLAEKSSNAPQQSRMSLDV